MGEFCKVKFVSLLCLFNGTVVLAEFGFFYTEGDERDFYELLYCWT